MPDASERLAASYLEQATSAFQSGDLARAEQFLGRALLAAPAHRDAIALRSRIQGSSTPVAAASPSSTSPPQQTPSWVSVGNMAPPPGVPLMDLLMNTSSSILQEARTDLEAATSSLSHANAGFGIRVVGCVLDVLIGWCIAFAAAFGAGVFIVVSDPGAADSSFDAAGQVAAFVAGYGALWLFNSLGWSPGKRAVGLRIIREDGEPPGMAVGLGRTAASLLSNLFLGAGYWSAIWNKEHRTWHDRMAGTYVVRTR